MKKNLEDILNAALAPEMKAQLQEAFDEKLENMRSEVRESVEAELANRYEHDKSQLVEAMEKMISDVVRVHEEAKVNEIKELREAKADFAVQAKAAKSKLRKQISEMANSTDKVIKESLTKEIEALRAKRLSAHEQVELLAEDVAGVKKGLTDNHKVHLSKINEFVKTQLSRELKEFEEDKKALAEAHVKLVSENKVRLAETQSRFIKEAARRVEDTVTSTLSVEMKQLHEDLEAHRQNMFGRKIFEAVAAEFQLSYFAEGTEMRKLQKVIESKDEIINQSRDKANKIKAQLEEAKKVLSEKDRKVALVESRAERSAIMSELLSNLNGEKKSLMESMLETTKTSALKDKFKKLLPVVLNEGSSKKAPSKKILKESNNKNTFTGNRRRVNVNKNTEESENDKEIASIIYLAGVSK